MLSSASVDGIFSSPTKYKADQIANVRWLIMGSKGMNPVKPLISREKVSFSELFKRTPSSRVLHWRYPGRGFLVLVQIRVLALDFLNTYPSIRIYSQTHPSTTIYRSKPIQLLNFNSKYRQSNFYPNSFFKPIFSGF